MNKSLIVFITLLSSALVQAQAVMPDVPPPSLAKWICYPEPPPESLKKERYYRYDFTVKEGLKNAVLYFIVDDAGYAMLDGRPLPGALRDDSDSPAPFSHKPHHFQLQSLLKAGKHCLSYNVVNHAGQGGVICRLELEYANGEIIDIFSNDSWKTSKTAPEGWNLSGFDDSTWDASQVMGDIHIPPWSQVFNQTRLRSRAEDKLEQLIYGQRQKRCQALLERYAKEPKPQIRIAYEQGQAYILVGDNKLKPIIYKNASGSVFENAVYRRQVRDFAQGGTHFHALAVQAARFWKPDNTIDMDYIKNWLLSYLDLDPDGYLMVSLAFSNPPKWWITANPDECVDYANGGRDFKEGDNLGRFVAPSFASAKWRREATSIIRKIVAELENSPLASRIFAYRLDNGVYTEWHYFGMSSGMPDSSRPMTDYFRSWLRRHYSDEKALQKAWNMPNVTFDNALTPPAEARSSYGADMLRDAIKDRWTIDYLAAHGEVCRDCLLDFNRAAKEACNFRALTGNFSGYFFGMPFPAEGWHLNNDEILDSQYVDFQSSPYVYGEQFRNPGTTGQARALIDSFRLRNKLCLLEADSRTHVNSQDGHTFAKNERESVGVLSRDMAIALQHGCGIWYFDFCKCWYRTPATRQYLHDLRTFHDLQTDVSSTSEIAVVGDYSSVAYHATQAHPAVANYLAIDETIRELGYCAAPCDTLSFPDLQNPKCKDYKVYLFINLYHVTPEKLAVINQLKRSNHTLIWLYAPGYLSDNGHGTENIATLTGFHVNYLREAVFPELTLADGSKLTPQWKSKFAPAFALADSQAVTLGTMPTSKGQVPAFATKAFNSWTSVFCSLPYIPRQSFQRIFDQAGVFRYSETPDSVVFANASILSLHANETGLYKLKFPRKGRWTLIYPQTQVLAADSAELSFKAEAATTYFFKIN